jgi:prolyl-tRNA synthetase
MRYSQLFGKTQKTIPSDAVLPSHKLLYQAGFIRRFSTGRWSFLPLGMRVWKKVFEIIEQKMDAIGAQRLVVPTLHPIEIWKATNRDQAFGEEMSIIEDHYGQTFALGATAEGMMAELVKMFSPSYKDLPLEIYQFSNKFRDDKRPRGGLLRIREFMMKDAYNFCADEKQFAKSYQKFYDAYLALAKTFDLKVTPVLADSGAIGGAISHEFMVDNKQGDNSYFICDHCHKAWNQERCPFHRPDLNPGEKEKEFKIIDQPQWVMTMEDNVKHYGQPTWRYLKNVVYKDLDGKFYIASIRGDQDVNETKLKRYLDLDHLEPATDADLEKLGTKHGYVHSWGIKSAIYIGDEGLTKVKNFTGGQKEDQTDSQNVNYGRDFKYKHLSDIVNAQDGDICADCKKGKLKEKRGIEWGHTFNIGYFYSRPQKCTFTDQKGEEKNLWMGSYGIGIERCLALVVETHHDEKGICWPKNLTPYQVHLLGLELDNLQVKKAADSLYKKLKESGLDVLYDDRANITPGEKFADADLIGIPLRVLMSKRSLKQGGVEYKQRTKNESQVLSEKELLKTVKEFYVE